MNYLRSVDFSLPDADQDFGKELLSLLSPFGEIKDGVLNLRPSKQDLLPQISLSRSSIEKPIVSFDAGEILKIEIANETGEERESPETYTPIPISEVAVRLSSATFGKLDHIGFNLPWFDGIHPTISKLRRSISPLCAYYRFPTGEEWDFILPVSLHEIESREIDLSVERRPKLEIVSFDKASTPLIQVDFSVKKDFEALQLLFPEGIADPQLKNVWVYVQNPYGIDICLVIGEESSGDWSSFFEGHRLITKNQT